MTIDFKELSELLAAIANNNITELTLKNADFELTVSQGIPQMSRAGLSNPTADIDTQIIAISTPESHQQLIIDLRRGQSGRH